MTSQHDGCTRRTARDPRQTFLDMWYAKQKTTENKVIKQGVFGTSHVRINLQHELLMSILGCSYALLIKCGVFGISHVLMKMSQLWGVVCHRLLKKNNVKHGCCQVCCKCIRRGSAWNDYSQILYSSLSMQQELPNMQILSLYRIAGNFWGRELPQISRLCGYSRKFSPQNLAVWSFWRHQRAICKNFSPTLRKMWPIPLFQVL